MTAVRAAVSSARSATGPAAGPERHGPDRPAGTLPSRGPKRRLVPAARMDEPLSRAATVGVSVGHRAAQLLDTWCLRRGLSGSLAFPAVQAGFGGLAGGEE